MKSTISDRARRYVIQKIICVILVFSPAMRVWADCPDGQDCTPNTEAPQASKTVTRENIKPMWIAGTVSFSTFYVLTIALTAALSEDDVRGQSVAYAAIPIVGPFVAVGNDSDDIIFDDYKVPLILSGVFQIASVGVLIAGLVVKRDVTPSVSLGRKGKMRLSFLPLGSRQEIGLSMLMTY